VTALTALSVVVPTRDTRALTLACLAAIANASPDVHCETIVVDDGSHDDTAEHIRARFPRVRLIRHDRASGFTAAANAGLRAASGSLLLLLNSDTEVQPGGLRALVTAFDRHARLGVAGAQLINSDATPQWSGGPAPDVAWLFAEASGLARLLGRLPGYRRLRPLARTADRDVAWVSGAALAMRRSLWDDLGPLDESFRLYGQDLDLCTRAAGAGWQIRVLHEFVVLHHQGATVSKVLRTADHHDPVRLWTDLLRWIAKTRGADAAQRAALALSIGGRVRLTGRRLLTPAIAAAARDPWRNQNRDIKAGIDALRGYSG
jgi:GT2 family glycosyltransferase